MNFLLQLYVSPDEKEKALWQRFSEIGIAPGKSFDYDRLPADQQKAIAAGVQSALAKIKEKAKSLTAHGRSRK